MTGAKPRCEGDTCRKPPATRQHRGSLGSALLTAWRRHPDLLGNTASLAATTGVTAGLGFVYWAVAAHLFSVRAVGYASAAVSAMMMLATVGMFGLGTLLIGELPRRNPRAGLVSAALLASGLGSTVLAIGFVIVAPLVSGSFGEVGGTVARAALFTVGVAATAGTLVFDQATIGLLRGGLQLSRNIAFSVVKLLALPLTAVLLHDAFGVGIILSWVTGIVVSLIPVMLRLWWTRSTIFARPDWGVLRSLGKTTLAHNWLNLSLAVRQSSIPIVVTLVISPSANAVFYAAWLIAGFLLIVPAHLSTVLFAISSADEQAVARKMRFTLRVSFTIGLPGMAVMILGAHPILSLFGARYAHEATVPLWLLVLGYPPAVAKAHYIAASRVRGTMARAAGVMMSVAALEIAVAAAGGVTGGLMGFSVGLLGARLAESLVTVPKVISIAMPKGRHRRLSVEHGVEEESTVPATNMERLERRRARLESLTALATGGAPTVPLRIVKTDLFPDGKVSNILDSPGSGKHDIGDRPRLDPRT